MKKLMVLTATLGLLSTGLYANDGAESTKTKRSYKKSKKARLLAKKKRQMRSKRKLATQTSSTDYSPYIHKGFRLGLASSNKTFEIVANVDDKRVDSDKETASTAGIVLGYERIKSSGWGFSVLFSHLNSEIKSDFEINQSILEGNATYGIGDKLYTYFGGSLSKMTTNNSESNELYDDLGTGVGTQLALGYQIAKHFSLEAKYAFTYNRYETSKFVDDEFKDIEILYTTSALQIGINGTF